ncbi:MAG: DUF3343 domain-containing protein [Tissierellia bacterium]|nr:DUF3343 domain-containing protein [Tissierellia bacterium]
MKTEEYGILTFNSTHHAISAEKILKEHQLFIKTIPTPREITRSCGLSILFILEDLDKIRDLHLNNGLSIKAIHKYIIVDGHKEISEISW